MTSLVYASKREVAILAGLTILDTIDGEWSVSRGAELLAMGIVGREGDCLTTEPVTDVISVTVDESDANWSGEKIF
jgi:hypothetical protein